MVTDVVVTGDVFRGVTGPEVLGGFVGACVTGATVVRRSEDKKISH